MTSFLLLLVSDFQAVRIDCQWTLAPVQDQRNGNNLARAYNLQFSSVTQSCATLCYPMDCSTPGFPVHHPLLELVQTHVHRVTDAIEPSHPLSSPFPALNLSQHQHLFHISVWKYSVANTLKYYFFSSLLEIMQLSNLCIRS